MLSPDAILALLDKGALGLCVLLILVVVGQYRENKALNTRLFEYADKIRGETMEALKASTSATTDLTKSVDRTAEVGDDRFETIKALHLQEVKIAELVTGAAAAVTQLREDVRQLAGRERRP